MLKIISHCKNRLRIFQILKGFHWPRTTLSPLYWSVGNLPTHFQRITYHDIFNTPPLSLSPPSLFLRFVYHEEHTATQQLRGEDMAGGPPSSIEIGDGDGEDYGYYGEGSSSTSLTYYERKFGGQGDVDPSSFIPSYGPTDKGETRGGGERTEHCCPTLMPLLSHE